MDAIERWQKMVAAQPANELARFSLGKALFDANRHAEALEHFEAALQKRPDWMVVQILIGKSRLALGDRNAARAAFERARQLAIEQRHEGPQAEMEQALAELEN
jgi:tetratricopeptide (TPR) repeat protein